jgi:hypothetical protein
MSRSVVRATALPPPRKIDDADFENLCRTFGIAEAQRQEAREFLDDCAAAFAEAIRRQRALPARKEDRLNIQRAVREIQSAARLLNQAKGPAAQSGLRVVGRRIGRLVSAPWLRRRFPDDRMAPRAYYWPHEDQFGRPPAGEPAHPVDVEDLSVDDRIYFATRRGRDLITVILAEIAQALDEARRHIVELPHGRMPLQYRNYLMAALAQLWRHLGRRPTSGTKSQFGAFCESAFDALGWPTEGVNAALPDAIATWRQLYRA